MACTTAIPPLTGFSVVPDINMPDSVYCAAVLTYYSELGTFITQSNALAVWIKATAEAACTAKDAAQTSATNAANSAILAQQQVVLAAAQVALAADQVDLAEQIVADAEANVIAAGQAQVDLAEQFADAAAISANDAQNSAITSQTWALESLESAGVAAALANLQFGGFYVLDGELYAEYNNLAISTPQIIDGEFIVEWI